MKPFVPLLTSALVLAGCVNSAAPALMPTRTPLPTLTPTATNTPLPSLTPTPTKTPMPTAIPVLGIDKPIEVGGDVAMQFEKAWISAIRVSLYSGSQLRIAPGFTWLLLQGEYTGDMYTLVGEDGWLQCPTFYVEGRDWPKYKTILLDTNGYYFQLSVAIRTEDPGPFVLHDALVGWELDLAPIMTVSTPTPPPPTPTTPPPTPTTPGDVPP